jgi:copper resistance protein C
MMRSSRPSRPLLIVAAAVLAVFVTPSLAMAHAELEAARPRGGATVEGTPAEIAGRYSEDLDPDGSSLTLVRADGAEIAKGIIDPENDSRMVIADVPDLAPGDYTVKSTTKSAEDGDIDREEWTFTVVAAPTSSPSPTPTPAPTASATAAASATPAPSSPPAASPSPVATASPTPSADGGPAGSGGDVLLPIIAAVVIVGAAAGYLVSRRDRTPTQP